MSKLDEIEARAAARTPGDWSVDCDIPEGPGRPGSYAFGPAPVIGDGRVAESAYRHDAEFCASAPTDIAYLLRVARAAERLAEWLDQSHEVEPECEEMGCVVCRRLAAYRKVRG